MHTDEPGKTGTWAGAASAAAGATRRLKPPLLYLGIFCLMLLGGCVVKNGGQGRGLKPPYTGPTEPMARVIEKINENNRPITSLWATHYYEATVVDEKKKGHFVNGDGVLLYRKPMEMRLIGNKDLVGTVFELGSTEERYWLKVVPEMDTMWWGHYRNLGRECSQEIPIRPDLVLEVLGVNDINTNLLQPPAPVMRFNPDDDAYMFVWQIPAADRWVAVKEVWYDRASLRPKLVLLFDDHGRVALRAYLSDYRAVELANVPAEKWPVVAGSYRLFFPDSGTKMAFKLDQVKLQQRGLPREGTIRFPAEPGVGRQLQLDQGCNETP